MNYIQVDIEVREEELEPVVGVLLMNDIVETVVEDPADLQRLLNKEVDYEWDYIAPEVLERENRSPKVTFYLEDTKENKDLAMNAVKAVCEAFPEAVVKVSMEDDSEWKDKWKEFFKPAKVGRKIVVKPTWYDYEEKDDDLVIEIDPGMAFGTGTHETTSLCLKMMEDYLKPGDKVLDVGCGSGILSIAGALLGASEVLGVEIDPVAVEIAQQNIELNKVTDVAKAQYGDLTKGIDFRSEIVVANLMADLVMMLSGSVPGHIVPGGTYISSGILVEKRDMVAQAIEKCGFKILEIREDGMWCAIAATI